MKKVMFLVNSLEEFDFGAEAKELLPETHITVGESLPDRCEDFQLVVLWSFRKLLPQVAGRSNVVVFHSSDLPAGRGWAPIYHALATGQETFTISGILPMAEADTGDVVAKARFRIRPEHTAENLRRWDHRISLLLSAKLLERFPDGRLRGKPQAGPASWYSRRRPEQNEVPLDKPLGELVPHLRACEARHPAFFLYQGIRYDIRIAPAAPPPFPADLEFEFYDSP